jgi:DNA mismatch repair ATPase MutS
MLEMNYIVRNADKRSLVIIDELCKETSVDEGSAICWSFCESLIKAQAWFLIATHNTLISKLEQIYFNVTKCVH